MRNLKWILPAALLCAGLGLGAVEPVAIRDGVYVKIRNGHFTYGGERLKLWGVNFCSSVKRGGEDLMRDFDRIAFMNFNGIRTNLSGPMFRPRNPETSDTIQAPVKGDDSQLDRLDCSIALGRERGIFFWLEFHQYNHFQPRDYDLVKIEDGVSRQEWEALARECILPVLVYLSPRAEEVFKRYAFNLLNHVNPYTGRRYAEEEAIACWQIFNENSAASQILTRPDTGVFGRYRQRRWNEFLRRRYRSDAALKRAWGALSAGESLEKGTVKFGPLPEGKEIVDAGYQYSYVSGREDADAVTALRRRDMMRFCYELYAGFNRRFTDYIRTLAPEGVGINVVPITSTCRYGNDLMMYAAADLVSDFTALGSYSFAARPWEVPRDDPFYPWVVRVNAPPLIENPIDCFRTAGKPYLIYEVNDYRPNPYRVEFPMRVAINSILRDGDGVFWFNWDDSGYLPDMHSDEDYAQRAMPMANPAYPNASLIMCNDEVLLAAIKGAGDLFRSTKAAPFARPVRVKLGGDVLLDMNNRNLPERLFTSLWRHAWNGGVELTYDLEGKSSVMPVPAQWKPPLDWRNGISADWRNRRGFYRVDRPEAKGWAGFLPEEIRFDGVRFSGFNREYAFLSLTALDGKPLAESREITLALACDSGNTGFRVDWEKFRKPWSDGLAEAIVDSGHAPVIIKRVGATIDAPALRGRVLEKYDFTRKCYETQTLAGPFTISPEEPFFFGRIVPGGK